MIVSNESPPNLKYLEVKGFLRARLQISSRKCNWPGMNGVGKANQLGRHSRLVSGSLSQPGKSRQLCIARQQAAGCYSDRGSLAARGWAAGSEAGAGLGRSHVLCIQDAGRGKAVTSPSIAAQQLGQGQTGWESSPQPHACSETRVHMQSGRG